MKPNITRQDRLTAPPATGNVPPVAVRQLTAFLALAARDRPLLATAKPSITKPERLTVPPATGSAPLVPAHQPTV